MRRVLVIASRWSGKQRGHLGRGLQVELVGLEPQPAGRVEVGGGADAQQHVVRLVLVPADVVEVVGGDQRQVQLRGETQQLLVEPPLLGEAVVLDLEEEAVLPEDVRVLAGDRCGRGPSRRPPGRARPRRSGRRDRPMSPSLCFASSSRSMRGL